jgi:hypothetical protein
MFRVGFWPTCLHESDKKPRREGVKELKFRVRLRKFFGGGKGQQYFEPLCCGSCENPRGAKHFMKKVSSKIQFFQKIGVGGLTPLKNMYACKIN